MKKPHRFGAWWPKAVPWLISCAWCGLIALKNERTVAAIRAGCRGAE